MRRCVFKAWRRTLAGKRMMLGVLLALLVVAALAAAAPATAAAKQGPPWSDVSAQMRQLYDVTNAQLATIDPGYPDRTWRPSDPITRGWLALKAVPAFGIPLAYPATPTCSDVLPGDALYPYFEGAYAVNFMHPGQINGQLLWLPTANLTRIQAAVTTARWAARVKNYDLATMYTQQRIDELLARFPDTVGDPGGLGSAYGPVVAFAIEFGIIRADANGNLSPYNYATRIDTASMILHALKVPAAK